MLRLLLIHLLFFFSFAANAQSNVVALSGIVKDKSTKTVLPFVNVVLKMGKEGTFVTGTVTDDEGLFTINNIKPGNYLLELSYTGYKTTTQSLLAGELSAFLDLGIIELEENVATLSEVIVTGQQDAVVEKMDKKTYNIADNITQSGGSMLQAMQNLPGVTINQEGKVQLRGGDKITVLIDGKQTALTGFGSQAGLDNIPASAIERIERIRLKNVPYRI